MTTPQATAETIVDEMRTYTGYLASISEEFLAFDASREIIVLLRKHSGPSEREILNALLDVIGRECVSLCHDLIVSLAPKGGQV